MKKNITNIILGILLITVIALIVWRHSRKNNQIPDILLGKPFIDVVEVKSKIAGKLLPAQEVEIKSSVSGIIEELFVNIGDSAVIGTPIAKIKPAPEPEELENARKHLKTATIQYTMEKSIYDRKVRVEAKGGMAESEMEQAKYRVEIKELEMLAAQKKLRLLLKGYLDKEQKENNIITSTTKGIITELPVKTGQTIIKRNTNNDGTTIALVANMEKLLFKGQISEYEVNKIKPGMPLTLVIGAYNNLNCNGRITLVAPQANRGQQTAQFNFEASVNFPFDSLEVKTGLTVVAEFITQKTDSVLCIEEKYLNYSGDSIFVVTVDASNEQVKKIITPGLSDGTKTEVLDGLTLDEKLKPIDWN